MSTAEYRKEKYDNVSFKIPKGKREEYKQAADDFGIAQSEMFRLAVDTFIAEKSLQDLPVRAVMLARQPEKPETLSADERRLLDDINQLPSDTRKALVKLVKSINQAGVVVKPSDQNTPK